MFHGGALRRTVAALLAMLHLAGCAPAWYRPEGIAPVDVVQETHPARVRVIRTGEEAVEVRNPQVRGDTLLGRVLRPGRSGTFAFARAEVDTLTFRGARATVVLLDSSIVDLGVLWQRADSLGGSGELRARWAETAIPLTDVTGIEVRGGERTRAEPAAGQVGSTRPAPGATVRLRIADPRFGGTRELGLRGILVAVSRDTLTVGDGAVEQQVPIAAVRKLEVLVGRKSNAGTGALVGLLAGGAIVVVGSAAASGMNDSGSGAFSDQALAEMAAVGLGTLVFLISTVAGAVSRSDKWQEVPLSALESGRQP